MSENNIIRLQDGRKLGYAEYGDLKGKPLFYFHGWPSSRLQAKPISDLAKELYIRVISIDRPGYGISDFKMDRKLLEWPDDVVQLANNLKIKKFAVVGVSGGGPYAAVCAYKIPQRLTRVGIVVGLSPTNIAGVLEGMTMVYKLAWWSYHVVPYSMHLASSIASLQSKYFPKINTQYLFLL